MKTTKTSFFVSTSTLLTCLLPFSSTVQAEEVFGQWCEPASEHNGNENRSVEFVWTDDELYLARFTSESGNVVTEELSSLPGNIYVKQGNVYGQRFRIHRNTGKLQLMDNTGVLTTSEIREEGQPESSCY